MRRAGATTAIAMPPRLPRLQLFEFNDSPRTPRAVRDTVVESLSRTLAWGHMLDGLVEPFEAFLADARATEVLDLGAGSGGPACILSEALARRGGAQPRFVLTDLHPRLEDWERARAEHPAAIDFVAAPVDATRIPPALAEGRARSIVNVMHHFPREVAAAILEDAVRSARGVFVAECFERNPLQFANFAFAGLPALMANPWLTSRDRLAKIALTWLTPAALAVALWDGVVSTLRVWSEDDLRAMVAPFGAGWRWEYGTFRFSPFGRGYYFYGVPREA